ncbi:hypothetical protein E2542_SST05447 [Spatholobus suberectus]|nr:hypothetical protein E2542_SST05447 [Spatholobus suberectus]
MEVVVAVPPPPPPSSMDFNFDSNCSSPYITAPSSPQRFGNFFFSAPTSPTRSANSTLCNPRHSSASATTPTEAEFEFDFGGHLQRPSLSAEELFLGGRIRPLKPPSLSSSRSEKRVVEESPPSSLSSSLPPPQHEQGRDRASSFSIPSTTRKESGRRSSVSEGSRSRTRRSSSVAECDDVSSSQGGKNKGKTAETVSTTTYSSFLSSISFTKGYRKWRLKDFLLFRSASEGRASDKDPFRKYAVLSKTTAHEDVRNLSFRSAESPGSVSRRRGPVSAHERHYTVNRAASVELKKKTLLPYKQGLLGCLGFNPGMHHFSARIGSSERS